MRDYSADPLIRKLYHQLTGDFHAVRYEQITQGLRIWIGKWLNWPVGYSFFL